MTTTASGLSYEDTKPGSGATPSTGQTCVMHYTGWLWVDGKKGEKFDSSLDRGRPFTFPLQDLLMPLSPIAFAPAKRLALAHDLEHLIEYGLDIADDRDIDSHVLGNRGRIDVHQGSAKD